MRQRRDFSKLHSGSSSLPGDQHRERTVNMGTMHRAHQMNLRLAIAVVVLIIGTAFLGSRLVTVAAESGTPSAPPPAAQAPEKQQGAETTGAQAPNATAAEKEALPPFRPRLPAYYGRVVDEKQRQKIYDIQRKYHPQIAELQRQLEKLIAQRDAEIEAVLTPQQKAEIQKMREEAAARRSNNARSQGDNSASASAQP